LVSVSHLGANVFARDRAGRTPRELTVKVRDENIQAQEKLRDGSLQLKFAESSRGDFDLVLRLLTDAESKKVDIPAAAAEEPRSTVQRGNVAKQMKALQSAALGNALTGIYYCFMSKILVHLKMCSIDLHDCSMILSSNRYNLCCISRMFDRQQALFKSFPT